MTPESGRKWTTEISRDGIMWPWVWSWKVGFVEHDDRGFYVHSDWRMGDTFSKDRARKKAIKARLSMERDDVRVIEEPSRA